MAFVGCVGSSPAKSEIIGTWVSSDGAILKIMEDGSFSSQFLPSKIFYWNGEFTQKINGYGKWEIRKGQTNWELYLNFKEYSGNDGNKGYGLPLLISKENSSWYLFLWEEEEGGLQYKFLRR